MSFRLKAEATVVREANGWPWIRKGCGRTCLQYLTPTPRAAAAATEAEMPAFRRRLTPDELEVIAAYLASRR